MKRYICLIIVCVFSLLVGFGLSSAQSTSTLTPHVASQEHSDSDAGLISQLDDCIQQRFLDVDKGFGIRRIIRRGETAHRFKPENAKELAIVEYLTRSRLNVALYLIGRAVIGSEMGSKELNGHAGVEGPVLLTTADSDVADLPAPKQLWKQAQKAMKIFEGPGEYEFNLGDWKFIARPVRASNQTCLTCHQRTGIIYSASGAPVPETKPLQIGDPLGVLFYGYKNLQQM